LCPEEHARSGDLIGPHSSGFLAQRALKHLWLLKEERCSPTSF
jgi:hypothetical protein